MAEDQTSDDVFATWRKSDEAATFVAELAQGKTDAAVDALVGSVTAIVSKEPLLGILAIEGVRRLREAGARSEQAIAGR